MKAHRTRLLALAVGTLEFSACTERVETMHSSSAQSSVSRENVGEADTLASNSRFIRVGLASGVSIDLPRSWVVVEGERRTALETYMEAVIDLSGLKPQGYRWGALLFALNPDPSLYASANVVSVSAAGVRPSFVDQLSAADLTSVNSKLREGVRSAMAAANRDILSWGKSSIDSGGRSFIVTEYLRHDPNGAVRVQISQAAGHDRTITLTLSARDSEWDFWAPVLRRIRNSLAFD